MSEAGRRGTVRFDPWRPTLGAAALIALFGLASPRAGAGDVSGFAEATAGRSRTTLEEPSTDPAVGTTRYLTQRYGLNWRRDLFPRLVLRLGGTMERQSTHLEPEDVDSVRKLIFPYARLSTSTGTFYSELLFDRSAQRTETAGFASELTRETYRATAGWVTPSLRSRLELRRTEGFDLGRAGIDTRTDRADLSLGWVPLARASVNYRAGYEVTDNRIQNVENTTLSHSARLGYSNTWRQGRVAFSGEYVVAQSALRFTASGTEEIVVPVIPFEGRSSLDDTPEQDALAANSLLVDRDLETSAGIDIAVSPAGPASRPRNLGFWFGGATTVNRVVVWVDRTLTPEVAEAFSWRVYASEDGIDWTLRATVFAAPFGPFQNRFLVDFADVVAPYLKLVVSPLTPGTPGASDFPAIAVTEIEAGRRRPPDERASRLSSVSQQLNTTVRVQLLPKPALNYGFSGFANDSSRGPVTGSMTNSLALSQQFGGIYATSARLSREDSWGSFDDAPAYLLAASLYATPLPTLSHAVTFGARDETGDDSRDDLSVGYSTTAALYRGIDANFIARRAGSKARRGGSSLVTDVGFGLTMTPHPAFSVNGFSSRGTTDFRGGVVRRDFERRTREVAASWRPFPLLYAYAGRRWETQENGRSLRLDNLAVSWTPFPTGSLRVALSYSESYRTETDGIERFFTSGLRWNVTPGAYLDMSYQRTRTEDRLFDTLTATSALFASARVSF